MQFDASFWAGMEVCKNFMMKQRFAVLFIFQVTRRTSVGSEMIRVKGRTAPERHIHVTSAMLALLSTHRWSHTFWSTRVKKSIGANTAIKLSSVPVVWKYMCAFTLAIDRSNARNAPGNSVTRRTLTNTNDGTPNRKLRAQERQLSRPLQKTLRRLMSSLSREIRLERTCLL